MPFLIAGRNRAPSLEREDVAGNNEAPVLQMSADLNIMEKAFARMHALSCTLEPLT